MEGKMNLGATLAGPGEGGGGRADNMMFIPGSGTGHPDFWI